MHASLLPASSDSVVNLARAATFTLLAAAILARILQFIVGSGSSKAGGGTASATADAEEGREGGSAAAASATADAGAARVGSHVYVDDSADPWPLGDIEAYLIDLDGTIYSPTGPIEGAAEFYAAVLRHKPHVFLSNTGAKGADGVRAKLSRNGIILGPGSQERHIWTATQAQCRFLADTLPPAARVFVIAGGNRGDAFWRARLQALAPTALLVSSNPTANLGSSRLISAHLGCDLGSSRLQALVPQLFSSWYIRTTLDDGTKSGRRRLISAHLGSSRLLSPQAPRGSGRRRRRQAGLSTSSSSLTAPSRR